MEDKVIKFPGTKETAKDVLTRALEDDRLVDVIVLGSYECGCEYRDTTFKDGPEALWLLERAKHQLMKFDEVE